MYHLFGIVVFNCFGGNYCFNANVEVPRLQSPQSSAATTPFDLRSILIPCTACVEFACFPSTLGFPWVLRFISTFQLMCWLVGELALVNSSQLKNVLSGWTSRCEVFFGMCERTGSGKWRLGGRSAIDGMALQVKIDWIISFLSHKNLWRPFCLQKSEAKEENKWLAFYVDTMIFWLNQIALRSSDRAWTSRNQCLPLKPGRHRNCNAGLP